MIIKTAYDIERYINKFNNHVMNMIAWHFLRRFLNCYLPLYYKKHNITQSKSTKYSDREVIVSLTTYPARIQGLPLVLETLFHQSIMPTRIVLWLATEQFKDRNQIEIELQSYINKGLEIRFCEDLRSHKKYYYAMREFPDALIITVDDDILYPENMIEKLLIKHKEYPHCIVTCRAHEMMFSNGVPMPYNSWNFLARNCIGPDINLCATSGAGCLYPPGALSHHVFDKEVFKEICFYADDIWLKCMSYIEKTPIVLTEENNPEIITVIQKHKDDGLASYNVLMNKNDEQLLQVSKRYNINWRYGKENN